jgi:hypothetical protein
MGTADPIRREVGQRVVPYIPPSSYWK